VAELVQRRPVVVTVVCTAALVAAGWPLATATIHLPGLDSLPKSLPAVAVSRELTTQYGQATTPAITVVARTDAASLSAWAQRWTDAPGVSRIGPAEQVAPGLSTVAIDMTGDQQGTPVRTLVDRIRADRPPGGQSWVTGSAAVLNDLLGQIVSRLPLTIGITLLGMVLLLFAMTGSVIVPLKAVVMNMVSLGATFGVMVAVFEHGVLAGPLGLLKVRGIDPFVLVIVFAFAFALSMDYEVFLLSRIKEYVDRGQQTDHAVRSGLQRSGRIITSAALLMVIVFGCFGLARDGQIQQIGLGLAVAVAIDATVVRCLLVPATMTLLGRWNWWAPGWLRRLSTRIGLREYTRLDSPGQIDAYPAAANALSRMDSPRSSRSSEMTSGGRKRRTLP
jgi:RND superfamily putative drug exporter